MKINNTVSFQIKCEHYPIAITPSPSKYLYVKVNGVLIKPSTYGNTTSIPWDCRTDNRIVLNSGGAQTVVCPAHEDAANSRYVEVFSQGWKQPVMVGVKSDAMGREASRSVTVDFVGKSKATHSIMWMELSKR